MEQVVETLSQSTQGPMPTAANETHPVLSLFAAAFWVICELVTLRMMVGIL